MCASKINGNMRANTLAEQRLYILWHTASSSYGYRKRSEFAPFSQNRTECFVKPVKISIFNIKHERRESEDVQQQKVCIVNFMGG